MRILGVDNGSTGSIARVSPTHSPWLLATPARKVLDCTIVAAHITRIDYPKLRDLLRGEQLLAVAASEEVRAVLERPLKNPKMFAASISGVRAFEATLIALEETSIPYEVVDSRKWQAVMLPTGIKGAKEWKKASLQRGCELFPGLSAEIRKQGDADALLMALWYMRKGTHE